jgi:hypothetical protein
MDTYNPAGHPEDPTLGMMANSPTTPALKTLQMTKDQVASVLQNFCNRLIVTIEPVFIKRSLEQIAQDRLKEYVPHDLVENEEIPVTGSDSERFTIINPLFEVYSLAASPSYILG